MKRCPNCLRDYFDDSLLYCLDDGSALAAGRAAEADATVLFHEAILDTPTAFYKPNPDDAALPNTIAVLPFLNLSRDEESDYFSDGLAEELLNVLSKIRGLRVAARTSAFSFKGRQATVGEIGRALNVASILEGSIRRAGARVRIAVQLVHVAEGYQLWSETYDRTMDDIFAVQDDIAHSVVEEIRIRLLGEVEGDDTSSKISSEVRDAVKGRAASPEAQRLMLLGRHFIDRTTQDDTAKAIECFKQALEIEPSYSLGWAELGRAYSIEAGRNWVPVAEGFRLSRQATDRALAIEPDLAEGHAQLGRIQIVYEWDIEGAEASYGRAVELAPGSSSVLDGAAMMACKVMRLDDAVEMSRRVLEQDPLSAAYWHNLGVICHSAGRLDEAVNAFTTALDLVPQRFVTTALLSLVLMDQGKYAEALKRAEQEPFEMWRIWALAITHFAAGNFADSDSNLELLETEHAEGNAYQIAEVYSSRKDREGTFTWIEKAFETRDPGLTHIKSNPRFHWLAGDEEWAGFLTKVGFRA